MARYTIELGDLLDGQFDLGLKTYPIFDETYREALNSKIKEHFRFREIGFETPALFKFFLNRTLNEIMPLYNQYYKSALLEFNPLQNANYTNTANHKLNSTMEGSAESTGNNVNTSLNMHSDTPQGSIDNLDSGNYLTSADKDTFTGDTTSSNSSTSTGNSTDDYTAAIAGMQGITGSELLLKFRETFLNIDMLVISELNNLFMGLY